MGMKILVAYDGSEMAQEALALGKQMIGKLGGSIYIATSLMIDENATQFMEEIQRAEKELQKAKNALAVDQFDCSTKLLRRGVLPGEDVVTYAQEISADMIIVGIKRQSKIGKLLLGSNAQFIILNSPCPVLSTRNLQSS